jgi:capsular polysaccharide export protein
MPDHAAGAPLDRRIAGDIPRRLRYLNAGFLRQPRLRRILALAGYELCPGLPRADEGVVVWGRSRYAWRGEWAAARFDRPLIRVEDAFLRSIRPGSSGRRDGAIGLMIDPGGVHFDASQSSALERILQHDPLQDATLLARAQSGIDRLRALDLSKYNLHRSECPLPPAGYVLVVDQIEGDASIRYGGADAASFSRMLRAARADHPEAQIVIKSHPHSLSGGRRGHFGPEVCRRDPCVRLLSDPVSPWRLIEGAAAVYTVSSQMGFEAILAGHRPQVFGQPFYAGWGLSEDHLPLARRNRVLRPVQLFAAAMIRAPLWYDPCRDRLCSFEQAVDQMEAELRAFRQDRDGHVACGMRLWKRKRMQGFFGQQRAVVFCDDPARAAARARREGRGLLLWGAVDDPMRQVPQAAKGPRPPLLQVEDGFLRSRGLGAALVPPVSLVVDDLGQHYDPGAESRLERLIAVPLPDDARARAAALLVRLIGQGISKYNLDAAGTALDLAPRPEQGHGSRNGEGLRRILVPGQVEDDASIRLGAGEVRSNLALLQAVRAANPAAFITYKPHPDVLAGLRPGALGVEVMAGLADRIAPTGDPIPLIADADEIWTMTSGLGFEALLRGKPVTCLGTPFYAGWGLTRDLGPVPARRRRLAGGAAGPGPDLLQLAHAALIAYPRYFDPVSGRPCPVEVALERLAGDGWAAPPLRLRSLARLQGRLATLAWLWRRG